MFLCKLCCRNDRKPLLYVLFCRIALPAEQIHVFVSELLILQCKQKVGHGCIRTCVSLCGMSPVNHIEGSVFSYDHVDWIEITMTYFVMLWHAVQSCQEFISGRSIHHIFQTVDLAVQFVFEFS